MNSSRPIIVSLSSFGATEVQRHGQAWFVHLCKQAGADGVEVRGELLHGHAGEHEQIRAAVAETALYCVYSSPQMLWTAQGRFDEEALRLGLDDAAAIGASVLKMSIGGFNDSSIDTLGRLAAALGSTDIVLMIENDQTPGAGTVHALKRFFAALDEAGIKLGMTFDVGNWHWTGECPLLAARSFAGRVRYVHCKGVQRRVDRWVAVPLTDSAAPWRAVLRRLPTSVPHAIEYPLVGNDLTTITRDAIAQLRALET